MERLRRLISKSVFYSIVYLLGALRRKRPARVVGDYSRPHLVWKLFQLTGLRPTSVAEGLLTYKNINATHSPLMEGINGRCGDISKSHVARVFEATFGYGLAVDPRTHVGPMVEKGEENAVHDGRIVTGPKEPLPGCVYQRLIDNRQGDLVEDLRPLIIGDEIAGVFVKQRPVAVRFSNSASFVDWRPADAVFSADEIRNIQAFARAIGLDIGELDTLRDTDGRLYIVDVANTPHSPGDRYLGLRGIGAMRTAAAIFERQFAS